MTQDLMAPTPTIKHLSDEGARAIHAHLLAAHPNGTVHKKDVEPSLIAFGFPAYVHGKRYASEHCGTFMGCLVRMGLATKCQKPGTFNLAAT